MDVADRHLRGWLNAQTLFWNTAKPQILNWNEDASCVGYSDFEPLVAQRPSVQMQQPSPAVWVFSSRLKGHVLVLRKQNLDLSCWNINNLTCSDVATLPLEILKNNNREHIRMALHVRGCGLRHVAETLLLLFQVRGSMKVDASWSSSSIVCRNPALTAECLHRSRLENTRARTECCGGGTACYPQMSDAIALWFTSPQSSRCQIEAESCSSSLLQATPPSLSHPPPHLIPSR